MNIINKLTKGISLIFAVVLMVSCSEERPIGSEITNYPVFEVEGGQYIIVEKGIPFTDPGVIALAGEAGELPVEINGNVDVDQIGLYKLDYVAVNADGFEGASFRYVIVADDPSLIAGNDLTGSYTRDSNPAHKMNVVKIADGFYEADDILPSNGIKALMAQVSDTKLVIPSQSSAFGVIVADEFNDAATSAELVAGTDINLMSRIGSFGVFARNFIRD